MRQLRFLPLMLVFSLVFMLAKLSALLSDASWLESVTISDLHAASSEKKEAEHGKGKSDKDGGIKAPQEAIPSSVVEVVNPSASAATEEEVYKIGDYHGFINLDKIPNYSEQELELLTKLSKRRQEIELINKAMVGKQNVMQVAETRIDDKLKAMEGLKIELTKLLDDYKGTNDSRLQNLVKIYESMKPKEAAQILEGLDMPILLQVLSRVKQMKAAPIIAQMNPAKAREITEMLAADQKLQASSCSCGEYPDISLFAEQAGSCSQ